MNNAEHEINKMIEAVKQNGDISSWQKHRKTSSLVNLISKISSLPKNHVPTFNMERVRQQVLNRMAGTESIKKEFTFSSIIPHLRLVTGFTASFLVLISLTVGTAVAALDSTPGSAIYPLKKIVENIQLKLAPSDQKASIQLKFANNRLEELQQVLEQKQDGILSEEQASEIVANTVKDLQKTASAAVTASNPAKPNTIVNKLTDISNKLRAVSVSSEGQVKIELQKALEATQITREQAIKNLEQAGLKVENSPISINDEMKASGKLTAVASDSVSIGTAKFLLTKDTEFKNMKKTDLKSGLVVDISGKIKDNKSYANQITLVSEPDDEQETETEEPDTTQDPQ